MMAAITHFWTQRSPRERWLLGVMLAMIGILLLVFAIILPLSEATTAAHERLDRAVREQGLVSARSAELAAIQKIPLPPQAIPLNEAVSAAARDGGFALDRADPQGIDRVSIGIAAVRGPALFAWLGGLERRGIFAETIAVKRNPDTSLNVAASLRRRQM